MSRQTYYDNSKALAYERVRMARAEDEEQGSISTEYASRKAAIDDTFNAMLDAIDSELGGADK